MKKETYNLLLRFIAGLAAALILVGGMALIGEKMDEGRTGVIYQASGLPTNGIIMTVAGQDVTVEEYLYYVGYGCDMMAAQGITDLTTELSEGLTAADYAAQQAVGAVTNSAVILAWAKEAGITMTEEEVADMNTQLDGVDYAAMGVSRQFLEGQLRYQYLSNHIVQEYTTEGGKLYPSAEDIAAAMEDAADHGHEHTDADIAMELCNEEYAQRCNDAEIIYHEKYNGKVNVAEFYEKMLALVNPEQ